MRHLPSTETQLTTGRGPEPNDSGAFNRHLVFNTAHLGGKSRLFEYNLSGTGHGLRVVSFTICNRVGVLPLSKDPL